MNACEAVQEMLAAHALAALGDGEAALVGDHLRACPRCRDADLEARACVDLVAAPPLEPPPELWLKICARIDRREQGADPVRDTEPSPIIAVSCSFCRGGLLRAGAVYCASCLAPHHPECFAEHGRCSVMGCGEARVVSPRDLPPPPAGREHASPSRSRPGWTRRRPWRYGLTAFALTGVAAAALVARELRPERSASSIAPAPQAAAPAPASPPSGEEGDATPAPERASSPLRLTAQDASLGELAAAVAAATGESIEVDPLCADLLVGSGSWEGAHWAAALSSAVEPLGLQLARVREGASWRWRLSPGHAFFARGAPERATATLAVDASYLLRLRPDGPRRTPLYEGGTHSVAAAPAGRGLAITDRRGLRVLQGEEPVGAVEADVLAVAWSPDGLRLAFLAATRGGDEAGGGRDGGVWLGLFDLAADDGVAHVLRRGLEVAGGAPALAWVEEAILVATDHALVWVPTVGGQAITLSAPSPAGYRRFGLRSSDPAAFLVEYPDGLEAWSLFPTRRRWGRLPCPAGYRVELATGAPLGVVVTDTDARLFSSADGGIEDQPAARRAQHAAWEVALAPTGERLAWIDGDAIFVRRLGRGAAAVEPLLRGVAARGLAWDPLGRTLAVWSDEACLLVPAEGHPLVASPVEVSPGATVQGVRWAGADLLVVSTRAQPPRAPRVVVGSAE